MSAYLSYRRRYSEPVKREPRFQWRLRVHSLMMDDSDKGTSLSEGPSERDTSRRETDHHSSDAESGNPHNSLNDQMAPAETLQQRRDRFTRTKSEGHLKLRVRFSKFSDIAQSFDEDSESSLHTESGTRRYRLNSEPEIRKARSSEEADTGSQSLDKDGESILNTELDTRRIRLNSEPEIRKMRSSQVSQSFDKDDESKLSDTPLEIRRSRFHSVPEIRRLRSSHVSRSFDKDDESKLDAPPEVRRSRLKSEPEIRRSRFNSEPEIRKLRSSQEYRPGPFGEEFPQEKENQSSADRVNQDGASNDDGGDDDNANNEEDDNNGMVDDETIDPSVVTGAMVLVEDDIVDKKGDETDKDVSRGAIPKRHSTTQAFRPGLSADSFDEGSFRKQTVKRLMPAGNQQSQNGEIAQEIFAVCEAVEVSNGHADSNRSSTVNEGHAADIPIEGHTRERATGGHVIETTTEGHATEIEKGHVTDVATRGQATVIAARGYATDIASGGYTTEITSEKLTTNIAIKEHATELATRGHVQDKIKDHEASNVAATDITEHANDSTHDAATGLNEDTDKDDDIESIIERIIAEEEAILTGKANDSTSLKSSIESLNDDDLQTLSTAMNEMIDEAANYKDDDNKKGINIARNTDNPETQRPSSLPTYQSFKDRRLARTNIAFSSSCPSAQKSVAKNDKDATDDESEDDGWAYLPVILLEDVFTLLSPKERHQASQVCRQWYDLFYSPRVWETFILLERTLTKKRFNLYKGYQRELCPGKTQLCFRRVGSFFKRIVVTPITDYFNLYEFLRILAAFLQYQDDHGLAAMPLLHTFDFTFACASRGDGEVIVHGTGGQILEMIKQLLIRISNLKHLKLNQLLVDETDVPGLFDAMANCFSECLNSLEMLNVTKVPLGLTDLARFRNLVKLTVSPQHINEEVLLLLAGLNLLQLHLLQDPYTCECEPVSYEAWKLVREMAPWLRVYLEVSGNTRVQLLIQPRAPVYGVFLRTPYSRLTNDLVMSLVEYYSKTLRYFVQECLPRIHGPRGIDARCDSSLLFLVRRCSSLHTLVVRERISTSTLILLAHDGKNLRTLLVRRHGLIKRCDWPQPGMWTKEFYARLKRCSLDYDQCIDEVCTCLRRRWRPMTDKQFMHLRIVPRLESF